MHSEYPSRQLDLLPVSGKRISFSMSFGPIFQEDSYFKCRVTFIGLDEPPREIIGDDSLQALILGVSFAGTIIKGYLNRGDRVYGREPMKIITLMIGRTFTNTVE